MSLHFYLRFMRVDSQLPVWFRLVRIHIESIGGDDIVDGLEEVFILEWFFHEKAGPD